MPQYTQVEFPLGQGIDRKTDPRKLPPGRLVQGENVVLSANGKLVQRYGLDYLGNNTADGTLSAPNTLATHNDELLVFTTNNLYSYSVGTGKLNFVDEVIPVTARLRSVAQTPTHNLVADLALNNTKGLVLYTWISDGALYAVIADQVTGSVLIGPTELAANGSVVLPKCISVANTFIAVYSDAAANIMARTCNLDASPLTWASASVLRNDSYSTQSHDVQAMVNCNLFALTYQPINTPNNTRASLFTYNAGLTAQANTSWDEPTANTTIATSVSANQSGILFTLSGQSSTANVRYHNAITCTVLGGPLTTSGFRGRDSIADVGSNVAWVITNQPATGSGTGAYRVNATANTISSIVNGRSIQPISRAFAWLDKVYYVGATQATFATGPGSNTEQSTTLLCTIDTTDGVKPSCVVSPRQATGWYNNGTKPRTVSATQVQADVNGAYRTIASVGSSTIQQKITVMDVAFENTSSNTTSCELGGVTYIANGLPQWFDGVQAAEIGYTYAPQLADGSAYSNANLTLVSAYTWGVHYSHLDATGAKHTSIVTVAANTMTGVYNGQSWTIPYYTVTRRQDNENDINKVYIEIFRTAANGDSRVLRRETDVVPASSGMTQFAVAGSSYNQVGGSTVIYQSNTADSNIANSALCYTRGGILDNVNPPSATACCVHKNRLWLAGCPDKKEIWYSKTFSVGEAPGFNELLTLRVDAGGDITALGSLDDKLIVFKQDRIFYLVGDGPTDAGTLSDLSEPISVSSDVGCLDPRSVVMMPGGLMFRSRIGIYLLTRSLEVIYIGQEVEEILTSSYTVVAANLVKDQTQVRFVCTGSESSFELRYDYRAKGWTTAKYWVGSYASPTYGGIIRSAIVSRNQYYLIDNSGNLWRENTSSWLDGTKFVPQTVEFGHFSAAGTQGYQEVSDVFVLYDKYTDCLVNVSVATDGGSYSETMSANTATLTRSQITKHLTASAMKSQSVQVKIETAAPGANTGNGRAVSLVAMTFKAGVLEGPFKQLSSTNKG